MVEAKDMTTIICEMDSMELCVWKEKHLQRACSGDEWIFREKEKEPEGIRVNFDVTHAYEIFSCLGRYWGDFNSCPDSETMGRVAKRWEEKYGLKLVELSHDYIMVGLVHSLKNKKEVFMNVNDLAKQVSSIITPQTDNFYRDIRIYGHFFHNTNDTMWWGDVGMKFLTRAPFDVRWLREERLDDPYGGFLYDATVEDKALIMFKHKYNQEKYDKPGADFSSCSYEFFYSNHPFLRTGLWSGTMRPRYAYVVDLKNKSFKLASQWKTKVPPYDTKEKYERTELNEIYNTLQKELDGIADQVQAEYLEMQRKAARAAYVRACFDPVNGREDKEALEEYYRAEQEFVKALYTLAEAVLKRKECTVIYDFLSESGTLTNNRISMLAFLAAIEKTRIW